MSRSSGGGSSPSTLPCISGANTVACWEVKTRRCSLLAGCWQRSLASTLPPAAARSSWSRPSFVDDPPLPLSRRRRLADLFRHPRRVAWCPRQVVHRVVSRHVVRVTNCGQAHRPQVYTRLNGSKQAAGKQYIAFLSQQLITVNDKDLTITLLFNSVQIQ